MQTQERQYLTAITIVAGIITLIDYNGQIQQYRQRGIQKFSEKQQKLLIQSGLLVNNWKTYKELPSYISISFEDPKIMGKAQAAYPNPEKIVQRLKSIETDAKKVKK